MIVALVWTVGMLSLTPLVQAQPSACRPPEARILDNSTMTKLTGQWFLTAATLHDSKFRDMLKGVQTSSISLYPSLANDKFRMKFYISSGGICVHNQTIFYVNRSKRTLFRKIGGKEYSSQLLATNMEDNFRLRFLGEEEAVGGLALYARNRTLSQEQQEEFQAQALCEGFSRNETIFFPTEEDVCQLVVRNEELEEKEKRKEKKEQEEQPSAFPSV
ncbi:alpha-1-acid glycoprotein-like [Ornithorhynchus anatinus]|uniref:Lipocalin/cytosolic fatty-acid binding domain-containing protein n=1 Tax=Ornithorhynchus anatinus TaxID=9258 RepID=A0A6I8P755_ORNAN|nr:alpha-1-acid glycoprotein-like [Ornithorhynchus anatinus]